MTEFIFVLLFTTAGAVATLLGVRASDGAPAVQWLAGGFLSIAAANLGLYAWPAIAADPAAAARRVGIAAGGALAVWVYIRLLRSARRAAARRQDGA